jgi:hypothetical protein
MLAIFAVCAAILVMYLAGTAPAQQKKKARATADDPQQPKVVEPGDAAKAPSDAIVLFDGKDLSGWTLADESPARCEVIEGVMHCRTGAGDIFSRETFRDAQIHLEFNVPHMPDQTGQLRGNSGVYIHRCWEVQILDSYQNPTYPDGSCGAVYGFAPPLVNASRPPGEWQSYDIVFRAPRCDGSGNIQDPGIITLFHNGVLVHDRLKIDKRGPGCDQPDICGPGQLRLQDHSGFPGAPDTTMRFRNIWIRKLQEAE